jgi:hypothetical protein
MGDIFSDFYNFILIFQAGEKVNEKWRRTAHGSDILKRKGYHENQCIEETSYNIFFFYENFGEVEKVLVISDGGGSRRTNGARALQRSGHPARCEGSYSEDRCGPHRPRDDPG